MNAPDRPKIEHRPYRKPVPAPGRPAAASKPPPPGGRPPKKKPRQRPLEAEIRLVVQEAVAAWGKATDGSSERDFIIKAIVKRLHGCHVPAQRRDKVAKRLPAGACYKKFWTGEKWIVALCVPNPPPQGPVLPGDQPMLDSVAFNLEGPGSFLTEQNVDKLYRKWKREQEGKKCSDAS